MKKNLKIITLCIISFFITACFTSNIKEIDRVEAETKKVSFIIYIAADNDLHSAAMLDLQEISASDTENINVIIFLDTENDKLKGTYYLKKTNNSEDKFLGIKNLKILEVFEEKNTGEAITLKEFLKYSRQNYPAEKYVLSIWSHGDAWYGDYNMENPFKKGIGVDFDSDNDKLNLWELEYALQNTEVKWDVVYFDACYMGSIELAYQLKDVSDYLVFSPSIVPVSGADYKGLLDNLNKNSDKNSRNMALDIVAVNMNAYKNLKDKFLAYTIVDQNNAKVFYENLKDVSEVLSKYPEHNNYIHIDSLFCYDVEKEHKFFDIGDYIASAMNIEKIGIDDQNSLESASKNIKASNYILDLQYKSGYYYIENKNIIGLSFYAIVNGMYKNIYTINFYKESSRFAKDISWVE